MAKTFNVEYGRATSDPKARFLPLWWERHQLDHDLPVKDNITNLREKLPVKGAGLYAFIGYHDTQPTQAILYIGKTTVTQSLRARVPSSLRELLTDVWHSDDGAHRTFKSDCWDVAVHWTTLRRSNLAEAAESLLVMSHSPPFNGQLVRRREIATNSHLIIVNTGQKGRLQPAVVGHAYSYWWVDG